jgi:hypothetical protein
VHVADVNLPQQNLASKTPTRVFVVDSTSSQLFRRWTNVYLVTLNHESADICDESRRVQYSSQLKQIVVTLGLSAVIFEF